MDLNVIQENDQIILQDSHNFFDVSNKIRYFEQEKERINFIKSVERLVRSCKEYKTLTDYLKDSLQLTHCSILSSLSTEEVKIEFHHAPFTLYDIVEVCMTQKEINDIPFNSLSIAEEVLALHYRNIVGLCPLSSTIHQMVHSGQVKLNRSNIIGNFETFYEEYKEAFTQAQVDKWDEYQRTKDNPSIFDVSQLFNEEESQKLNDTINSINNKTKITTLNYQK